MRKLLAVLVAAVAGVAALAGTSSADTGYQVINPYRFPTSCGGLGGGPWVVSAAESGGLPVEMKFGWAALQQPQLDKFLAVQNGTMTLTAPDGTIVFSDSWTTGDATGWSAYTQTQVTPDGTHFFDGWGTRKLEDFGALSNPDPGTDAVYSLSMDLELTKTVNDGFGSYKGAWVKLANCPLIVHNYDAP